MKKNITTFFIILSFTLTMCSQQIRRDSNWNSLKLNGRVKSIIEFSYPDAYENEEGEFQEGLTTEIYYYLQDENRDVNKLMDSLTRVSTDALIFLYNKEGNLLKTEQFKARGSYIGQAGSTYEYDSKGKLILVKGYNSDFMTLYGSKSISFFANYKYDSAGRLLEEIKTTTINKAEDEGTMENSDNSKYIENTTYIYNEKGDKIEENHYINKKYISKEYKEDYKLPYEKKFMYDEKGRLYEEEEKTLAVKNTGYYSSIKEVTNKIITVRTTYKYNEENCVQSKEIQYNTGEKEKYFYTYDNLGNMNSERYYRLDRITKNITYIYKYDKQGNWIEKLTYTDGELDAVNKRIINYY